MNIFLDTNVVVDFFDVKRPRHKLTVELIKKMANANYQLIISEDILITVYYICKKTVNRKRLLRVLEIANRNFLVVHFANGVIDDALRLCQKNSRLDLEDTLQAVCAQEHDCDMIITNDKKFPKLKIPVKTTKDFLSEYDEEE